MPIRKAIAADAEQIFALEQQAGFSQWSHTHIQDSINTALTWVLVASDQIIGYVFFSAVLYESELLNIVIHPSYRRQGLAQQLLLFSFEQLQSQQIRQCFLEVADGNTAAIELYQQLAFDIVGKRKHYYGQDKHALLMAKQLKAA